MSQRLGGTQVGAGSHLSHSEVYSQAANDDFAEKSMRRRSHVTSSANASLATVAQRVAGHSTPSQPATLKEKGSHPNSRRVSGRFQLSGTVADESVLTQNAREAPREYSDQEFDEWMRLLRTNRLKPQDTFNVDLIDCFYQKVTGFGSNGTDSGFNFSNAALSLQSCAILFKKRVNVVERDAKRLYDGVLDGRTAEKALENNQDHGTQVGEGYDSDLEDEAGTSPQRRRKRRTQKRAEEAWILPAEKLAIDTAELETTIDPLFRKMCADFDKRGASGMLQCSLNVGPSGRYLLDTGEDHPATNFGPSAARDSHDHDLDTHSATSLELSHDFSAKCSKSGPNLEAKSSTTELGVQQTQIQDEYMNSSLVDSPSQRSSRSVLPCVDLAYYRLKYFGNSSENLVLCPSMPLIDEAIRNPQDDGRELIRDVQNRTSEYALPLGYNISGEYAGQDAVNGDDIIDDDDILSGFNGMENDARDEVVGDLQSNIMRDYINDGDDGDDAAINSSVIGIGAERWDEFDRTGGSRNWAGVLHWKVKWLQERLTANANPLSGSPANVLTADLSLSAGTPMPLADSEAGPNKANRQVKQAISINFLDPEVSVSILEPAPRSTLIPSKRLDLAPKHLLPEDMRVSARQFTSLSLRPESGVAPAFCRLIRAHAGRPSSAPEQIHDEFDEEEGDRIRRELEQLGQEYGDANSGPSIDDDLIDGEEAVFTSGPHESELRPQSAIAKLMDIARQGEHLSYARSITRVDIRALKELMWTETERELGVMEATLHSVIAETAPRYLNRVGGGTAPSPAMCFLSMLHLANEHGLKLENTAGLNDVQISSY